MTERESGQDETIAVLSDVVHDLKGPVIVAKGYIDIVGNIGELSDTQKQYLGRAGSALDRMERLITNILDYARLGGETELRLQALDLYEVVMAEWSLISDLATRRNLTLEVEGDPGTTIVSADPHFLSQIVYNLLINAINYNRDGGKIIVRLSIKDGLAQIEVADTGLGIAEDQLEKIFERFYRASITNNDGQRIQRGTGLGLAIAKAFVELHHGDIWVESTLNVGTTFTFTLPVEQPVVEKPPRKARSTRFNRLPDEDSSEESDAVDDDSQEALDSAFDSDDYDSRDDKP